MVGDGRKPDTVTSDGLFRVQFPLPTPNRILTLINIHGILEML